MADRQCDVCSSNIPSGSRSKRCSDECRKAAKARVGKAYYSKNKERIDARNKEYRESHVEEQRAYFSRYRNENKDQVSASKKEWYSRNSEGVSRRMREYYAKNSEAVRSRVADYNFRNPDRVSDWSAARRARESSAFVENVSRRELVKLFGAVCHICDYPIDMSAPHPLPESFSVDHVVPLSKGGKHSYENCRPSHLSCNCKKQANLNYLPGSAGEVLSNE